jgi:hypothetical protein
MKPRLVLWTALLAAGCLHAQDKQKDKKAPAAPAASAVASKPASPPPAASTPASILYRPEPFLLLPEPREMRVGHSIVLGDARHTAFTPVRAAAGKSRLEPYSKADFAKLGISSDSFSRKARAAADRLLTLVQPELIKDDSGRIRYAVYRGDDPIYACLLIAPSLAKVFVNIFGPEIWVAAPDRHALYIFPPDPAALDDFAADLQGRFEADAFAASEEVFSIKGDDGEMKVIGTFRDR